MNCFYKNTFLILYLGDVIIIYILFQIGRSLWVFTFERPFCCDFINFLISIIWIYDIITTAKLWYFFAILCDVLLGTKFSFYLRKAVQNGGVL